MVWAFNRLQQVSIFLSNHSKRYPMLSFLGKNRRLSPLCFSFSLLRGTLHSSCNEPRLPLLQAVAWLLISKLRYLFKRILPSVRKRWFGIRIYLVVLSLRYVVVFYHKLPFFNTCFLSLSLSSTVLDSILFLFIKFILLSADPGIERRSWSCGVRVTLLALTIQCHAMTAVFLWNCLRV